MITKTEAMAKLTAAENAEYSQWEAKIDEALRTFAGRTTITVTMSVRVRDRLMNEYRTAGWTVEYGDDQRDGAWLTFS